MRSYRTYLKSVGRKPLPSNLRTVKRPGDLEIVYRDGEWVTYRHEGEAA